MDPLAMVWLQARLKIINYCKAQVASYICSQYHNRQYLEINQASLQLI